MWEKGLQYLLQRQEDWFSLGKSARFLDLENRWLVEFLDLIHIMFLFFFSLLVLMITWTSLIPNDSFFVWWTLFSLDTEVKTLFSNTCLFAVMWLNFTCMRSKQSCCALQRDNPHFSVLETGTLFQKTTILPKDMIWKLYNHVSNLNSSMHFFQSTSDPLLHLQIICHKRKQVAPAWAGVHTVGLIIRLNNLNKICYFQKWICQLLFLFSGTLSKVPYSVRLSAWRWTHNFELLKIDLPAL